MLAEIRKWLDRNRFEPSAFAHFQLESGMIVRVSFQLDHEALAFAVKFDGMMVQPNAAIGSEIHDAVPAGG
jgi:hypothetical protein